MSLSTLLDYDSDDDDGQREQQQQQQSSSFRDDASSSPAYLSAPIPVHSANGCTREIAAVAVLQQKASTAERKRKREQPQVEGRRQRRHGSATLPSSSQSSVSSTLAFLSSPPSLSTVLSFPPSPSNSPAAAADLASLLPPPVHATADSSTRVVSASSSPADVAARDPAVPDADGPAAPPSPPLPPPAQSLPPTTAAAPDAAPALPASPLHVLPPPGMRYRAAAAAAGPQSKAPQSQVPLSSEQAAAQPSLPVSASPHWSFSSASDAVIPAAWDEPRMQRQFASAMGSLIDIRADELTSPLVLNSSSAASSSHSAPKLRTVYWDARAGREVMVEGTEGKQRRVHQINSLALQAQKLEADILRARDNGSNIRKMARQKYGW